VFERAHAHNQNHTSRKHIVAHDKGIKMDTTPIYFEGVAVITHIVNSTGAAFAVTEYGDTYVPAKYVDGYGLKIGTPAKIQARKNFNHHADKSPYVIIDVVEVLDASDAVTGHITQQTFEDELTPSFSELTNVEKTEVVREMFADNDVFTCEDVVSEGSKTPTDVDRQAAQEFLDGMVDEGSLYEVSVCTGSDGGTVIDFAAYTMKPQSLRKRLGK